MLDAGEKTSPVARDAKLDASESRVWLYNHLRNQFIEYAKSIVESRLHELSTGDIPQKELDRAFKAARKAFSSSHKISTWTDTKPAALPVKKNIEDELDIDISDDEDIEEFIDFDEA